MKIDWNKHKVIVLTSDDWGNGGFVQDLATYHDVMSNSYLRSCWEKNAFIYWATGTLETPNDMQKLFDILLNYKGGDNLPAIFQPNYVVANPNFELIKRNNFSEYVDISIAERFPNKWERGNIIGKAKEGMALGIWHPEYHARFHHANGKKWIEILKGNSKESEIARMFFDKQIYSWGELIPEYLDMDKNQQEEWLVRGMKMFFDTFGYYPKSTINGDYTEETEKILSEQGIKVRINKRWFSNSGTKCGSNKFANKNMGEYSEENGLTYIDINVLLEPLCSGAYLNCYIKRYTHDIKQTDKCTDEYAYRATLNVWSNNLPAVVTTHRLHYVSVKPEEAEKGRKQLKTYLSNITRNYPETVFITSDELAQLYRKGKSIIKRGGNYVVRNYTTTEKTVEVDTVGKFEVEEIENLNTGEKVEYKLINNKIIFSVGEGDYIVKRKN